MPRTSDAASPNLIPLSRTRGTQGGKKSIGPEKHIRVGRYGWKGKPTDSDGDHEYDMRLTRNVVDSSRD